MVLAATLPVFDMATNSVAKRIAGADPAVCLSRFGDYPPSKGKLGFPRRLFEKPFPANEKFWLRDVDFSCVSPWNDSCGTLRAGTAISKRHVIFAKHFPLWKGVRILFVGQDGQVCPRSIEATKEVPKSDILIGLLNAELTPNIKPAKILPLDYEKYVGRGGGLPVVTFDQHENVYLTELTIIVTPECGRWQGSIYPKDERRHAFRHPMIGGDSGNPAFLLIGNEPILLYCLKAGNAGGGPAIHRYRNEIQKAMDELCLGYKLEAFDFAALERK